MTITQEQNVPALRFPEFSGEWEKSSFGKLFNISAGGDIEKQNVSNYLTDKFCYPIYANAKKNKGFYGYSNIYKVDQDVITVAGRGVNLGIAHARKEKFVPIVRLLVLRPKTDASVEFFEQVINQMNIFIESTGVPQLTAPQLSNYKLFFTALPEQQKIASFLTSVDTKIEQLGKKKALLEQYKKGMMQKLFSQTLRFQDEQGNDFPDWKEKKLGDIGKFKSGVGFSNAEQGGQSGIPFFKVSDMNLIGNERVMTQSNNHVSDEQIQRLKYKPIIKPAIIFAKVGAAIFLERKRLAKNFLIDNNMMAFVPAINQPFMKHVLDMTRLSKFAQTGALPSYNGSDLATIKISIPKESEEQQKIANFLSALDQKIDLIATELKQAQSFKKGLLQQMFV